MNPIEKHPLQPFLPENSRLLMLGSFPPARKRWCMDFYYPNFNNDMWRIFGLCFYGDALHFVNTGKKTFLLDDIIRLLKEKGIALYDTASAVRRIRNTASDKDLEIIRPTDIGFLLRQIPQCDTLVTTGQKATDLLTAYFGSTAPPVGGHVTFTYEDRLMRHFRMPSSSRAYPMKIGDKASYYRQMFVAARLLNVGEGANPGAVFPSDKNI